MPVVSIGDWIGVWIYGARVSIGHAAPRLWYFPHHLGKSDDLVKYFHEKLNCGRQLGLSPQMILEGLTDGLPTQFKQLMTVQPPNTSTKWLTVATKLLKIQQSSEQNAFRNNEPPMRKIPNFSPRQQPTFVPRPQNA
ncbi:hypothetical protein AVEN_100374-1 [Araneus ventricosus]|uniref:Uncharacterized protein n=1 Tax=Araneus ventricosus TaxID=182803 RepID=A0A4Y2L9B3_ARAVE|nr:hypothetical protein AVEN_100374-1 [Araneus ventricosus]